MTKHSFDDLVQAVHDETFGLLMNFYFFKRRLDRLKGGQITELQPEDVVEEISFIESMERDIISGLCRLDDDDSLSFRSIRKQITGTKVDQSRVNRINSRFDEYRKAINPIKTKCRVAYIAHRTELGAGFRSAPDQIGPLVQLAVELLDLLTDVRQQYVLEAPDAPRIDLRERTGF